jgi:hypothetical protein
VAQLIRNLQEEVRHERRRRSLVRHCSPVGAVPAESSTNWRISAVR